MAKAFHGRIDETLDALIILEACRQGVLPKINRRLLAAERGEVKDSSIPAAMEEPELLSSYPKSTLPPLSTPISLENNPRNPESASHSPSATTLPNPSLISPGSVFVFDEEESGICRWTDGRIWSPSRICGNFLVYRELFRKLTSEKCLTPKEKAKMKDGSGLKDKVLKERVEKENLVVLGCMKGTFVLKKDGLIKKTICVKGINLPLPLELENRPTQQTRTRGSRRASWASPRGSSKAGVQHLVCYEKPGAMEDLHRPQEYAELLNLPLSKTFIMMQKYRNAIRILPIAPDALPIEPSDEYIASSRVVEARSVSKDARIASNPKTRKDRRKSTSAAEDSESEHETESSGDEFSGTTRSSKKIYDMTTIPGHPYPTRAQNRQFRQAEQRQIQQEQLHRMPSPQAILSLASERNACQKDQTSLTQMSSKVADAKPSGKETEGRLVAQSTSSLLHAIPGSPLSNTDNDLAVHGYKTKEGVWRVLPNGDQLQENFTMSHGPPRYENIPRRGQEFGSTRKALSLPRRETLQTEQHEERVLLNGLSSNESLKSNAHGVDYELGHSEQRGGFTENEKISAERNYQVHRCESINILGSQAHHHIASEYEIRTKRENQLLKFGEVSGAHFSSTLSSPVLGGSSGSSSSRGSLSSSLSLSPANNPGPSKCSSVAAGAPPDLILADELQTADPNPLLHLQRQQGGLVRSSFEDSNSKSNMSSIHSDDQTSRETVPPYTTVSVAGSPRDGALILQERDIGLGAMISQTDSSPIFSRNNYWDTSHIEMDTFALLPEPALNPLLPAFSSAGMPPGNISKSPKAHNPPMMPPSKIASFAHIDPQYRDHPCVPLTIVTSPADLCGTFLPQSVKQEPYTSSFQTGNNLHENAQGFVEESRSTLPPHLPRYGQCLPSTCARETVNGSNTFNRYSEGFQSPGLHVPISLYNSFSVDTNTGEYYGVPSQRGGSYDHPVLPGAPDIGYGIEESLDWGRYTSAREPGVDDAIAAATNGQGFSEDEDAQAQSVKRQRTFGTFNQKESHSSIISHHAQSYGQLSFTSYAPSPCIPRARLFSPVETSQTERQRMSYTKTQYMSPSSYLFPTRAPQLVLRKHPKTISPEPSPHHFFASHTLPPTAISRGADVFSSSTAGTLQQPDKSRLSPDDTFMTYPIYVDGYDRSKTSVLIEEMHNLHAEDSNNDYTEGYAACSDRGCVVTSSCEVTQGATSDHPTFEGPNHAGVNPLASGVLSEIQTSENRLIELSAEGRDINYLGSGNPLGQEEYLLHEQHPNLSQFSQQLRFDEESSDGSSISGRLSPEDLPSAVCMQEHATHDVISFLSDLRSGAVYEPPSSDTHQFSDPSEQNVFKDDLFDPYEEDQVKSESVQG